MAENRVDIPSSIWERLASDKRLMAVVVIGALLVAFVGGALVVRALSGSPDGEGGSVEVPTQDPGATSSQGENTDGAAEGSSSEDEPSETGESDVSGIETSGEGIVEPQIAYRLDDSLWVSAEDGTSSHIVIDSRAGSFALSPDASVLAWIDADQGALHLTNVESGDDLVIGAAIDIRPAWAPDSSFLAYTAPGASRPEIRTVRRTGRQDTSIAEGHSPALSPDGSTVVYIDGATQGASGPIVVKELGGSSDRVDDVLASSVVFGVDGLVYAVGEGPGSNTGIFTSSADGSDPHRLVRKNEENRHTVYSKLMVSPDGSRISYSAIGDDGFSRSFIVRIDSEDDPLALTIRRDTYPMRWSSSGEHFFFVEGNAFQGEATALMRVTPDGLGRVVVVDDARL